MAFQTTTTKAVLTTLSVLMAGALAGCTQKSADYVLHYSTYSSANSDQSKTVQRWAEEIERLTDGKVQVEFHYSQSLIGADSALQATLDGRTDLAQVGSMYAASDLPMYTVTELPFETQNPKAQMTAIERLYNENTTFREDFDRQGAKLLFPLPLGAVVLGLNEPADSPADLRGRSIRSGGLTSEVLLTANVNPVAMTANDIYESMERGIIDGYSAIAAANLPAFSLSEATPYLVNPGIGTFASSIVIMNVELFESMPQAYQEAIEQASAQSIDVGLKEMDAAGEVACNDLLASNAVLSEFADADIERWSEQVDIASNWIDRYARRSYDAQSVLEDYRRIIDEEERETSYADPLLSCLERAR
ncbi:MULTISPECIES: C4-dicarboxylate TRAP transporter substrate-binding protein [unclassified Halomonas]|uniref:C4-dicarboxylate TRAP transporter substrate-binding protein n=1 Tax=unclassified Halomonas TaxID=2609666 RepID=UPI0020769A6C|nr:MULTISPECIES: C4-dicarboxylate TRAP transporter substrate-binding protein [unclassified Halomonas]